MMHAGCAAATIEFGASFEGPSLLEGVMFGVMGDGSVTEALTEA